MKMKGTESFGKISENAPAFAVRSVLKEDFGYYIRGDVFFTLRDGKTGEIQEQRELRNLVVLDASILIARLMKNSAEPPHGIYALAVGTGDAGWDKQNPPAPTVTQRSLYSELARKTFTDTQFIDGAGVPTAIPTKTVDFTTTFAESEAVGPLVEMGLLGGSISTNMAVKNPILPPNGPYNPSVDTTLFDSEINFLTFKVVNKPPTSTLTIVWRITF
jgi:hypothetical protein